MDWRDGRILMYFGNRLTFCWDQCMRRGQNENDLRISSLVYWPWVGVPYHCQSGEQWRRSRFWGEIQSPIWDTITVRYQWDFLVEVAGQELGMWIWISGRSVGHASELKMSKVIQRDEWQKKRKFWILQDQEHASTENDLPVALKSNFWVLPFLLD